MKLKNVDPTEFSEMYNNSFEPKRKVDKEAVQSIVGEFVYSRTFIMEIVLSEEDRPNARAIVMAIRDFISTNNLAIGLHERAGRIFLRNDTVPVCLMVGYPRGTNADIKTLEGWHHANYGDYVIQGIKGEIYPCKPDIFEKTYEAVTR